MLSLSCCAAGVPLRKFLPIPINPSGVFFRNTKLVLDLKINQNNPPYKKVKEKN
jgi:hypothetical protein